MKPSYDLEKYIKLLKPVASLSYLFSDNEIPYVNSKFVERLYAIAANAEDTASDNSSFDAIAPIKVGVGIKTFTSSKSAKFETEKIAEFTKDANAGMFDELNEEQKKAAAEALDKQNFDKLEKELQEKISESSMLAGLQGQMRVTREKDGLRIEVIDKADFAMFALGTNKMMPRAQALVDEIARSVANMPNKVTVRGHTDSIPFANPDGRNNWSLSAERAEAMRQLLEKRGVKSDRFQSIEGVADTDPFNPADKADPRNRRISVTIKYQNQ